MSIDALVQTVCDLVSHPSTSDALGGNEGSVQAYVADQFRSAGARVKTFEAADVEGFFEHPLCCGPERNYKNRPTVVGEVGPADAPAMMVLAHSDVVSINNDPSLWQKTMPFKPMVEDGIIYGRGCSDDKWGVACLIHILHSLKDKQAQLTKRVVFASTMDEENGVANGLLLLHLADVDFESALYLDGSNSVLTVGNLGGSNLYLHFEKQPDHDTLKQYESKLIAACKELSEQRSKLFVGLFEDNTHVHKSAFARLTEDEQLVIGFYTLPGEDGKALGKQIETLVHDTLGDVDSLHFTYRTPWFEPTVIDADHPFVHRAAQAYRATYGSDPTITTISKQDSFLFRQVGIPTISFGPGLSEGAGVNHEPDEQLEIHLLEPAYQFSKRMVYDWLGLK